MGRSPLIERRRAPQGVGTAARAVSPQAGSSSTVEPPIRAQRLEQPLKTLRWNSSAPRGRSGMRSPQLALCEAGGAIPELRGFRCS